MGLRFRRSLTLCKGVKLNFGKTGMSISTGVKGFRQTYNLNTGKKTTTVGLPGTGLFYTTTEGGKKKENKEKNMQLNYEVPCATHSSENNYVPVVSANQPVSETKIETKIIEVPVPPLQEKLTYDDIKNIFRVADEKIDWFEILSSEKPTDDLFNKDAWSYLHSVALKVCQGDIDTYLKVIQDVNPFEDLLDYASDFNFGTDESTEMHIEFKPVENIVDESDNELYNDFICGCAIRAARDTFALLPLETVFVDVEHKSKKLISVKIDRVSFERIKFSYSDPSEIIEKYRIKN